MLSGSLSGLAVRPRHHATPFATCCLAEPRPANRSQRARLTAGLVPPGHAKLSLFMPVILSQLPVIVDSLDSEWLKKAAQFLPKMLGGE